MKLRRPMNPTRVVSPGQIPMVGAFDSPETGQPRRYPNRYRIEVKRNVGEASINVVYIVNGKEGWQQQGGAGFEKMDDGMFKATQMQSQVEMATALVPLLDKEKYSVSSIGEHEINGKKTTGLNIKNKAGLDVSFYFDQETHLVVKHEYESVDFITGKVVLAEAYFSKFKKTNGLMIPMYVDLHLDGNQFETFAFDGVQFAEQLSRGAQTRPAMSA